MKSKAAEVALEKKARWVPRVLYENEREEVVLALRVVR